jgi:hypothetical protein
MIMLEKRCIDLIELRIIRFDSVAPTTQAHMDEWAKNEADVRRRRVSSLGGDPASVRPLPQTVALELGTYNFKYEEARQSTP